MPQSKRTRRLIPLVSGGLIVMIVLIGLIWVVSGVLSKKPQTAKRQTLQVVKIIRPPPPPEQPPPPPPEKVEQPIPKDTPDPKPDQTPPDQPLGLDADAADGSDGFGLAARKGGQDLVGSSAGAFAWYTSLLKSSVLDVLSDDERIRHGNYSMTVRVWLASDGRVERIAIAQPSGNKELDGYIQHALTHLTRVREPPFEMPQPVTLKIVSRG